MVRMLALALLASCAVAAAEWGQAANGLRMALAVKDGQAVVTFENLREGEMFLPLGSLVGVREAGFVHLYLISPDGNRRQLRFTGGTGVAPGRLLPYIVPMMGGSIYTVRTRLANWRLGSELRSIDRELSRGAKLQAGIEVSSSFEMQNIGCYGLRMFWSGRTFSNLVSLTGPKHAHAGS